MTAVAPAFAAKPFKEAGVQNFMYAVASDCSGGGNRTTCTETWVDVFPVSPDTIVVCYNEYTYSYNERTGRGRIISDSWGCSETSVEALRVIVSGGVLTATLSDTAVELYECNRRRCTPAGTVTVSASASGSPVTEYSGRGSFSEGRCTFRWSFTGKRAELTSGSITVDGTSRSVVWGEAGTENYSVTERCR